MFYNITYELKNSEKDYSLFFQTLKALGTKDSDAIQCMKNSWFVNTSKTRKEIYELLKGQLDLPDLLLINTISLREISGWLPSDSVEWVKDNLNNNL